MKLHVLLTLVVVLVVVACQKENNVIHHEPVAATTMSNATADDAAYFLNSELSAPRQYITTKTHEQNSGEETTVYTTFQPGHIDSLYITMTKHDRSLVQTMYANGVQIHFKNIHDSVGKVAIDLDGNTVSGISIPVRTIFNPEGSGYPSGVIFNEVLYSMRIAGVTHRDSVVADGYMLVGSKPQIGLENTGSIKNHTVDTLFAIDLTAISDFVIIQDIPLTSLLTNATIDGSTLRAIDNSGKSIGTVSKIKQGKVIYITIAIPNYFKVYPGTTTKVYLLGKMYCQSNWQAVFSLGKPQSFVWDDDTYRVFKGKSNATYLIQSGDYRAESVIYP